MSGLYKGLGVQLFGVLPAQVAYIATLEHTKHVMRKLDAPSILGNLISGALASFMSTSIAVPVDVISQRQMIQGTGYHLSSLHYAGALDAFRSILRTEGNYLINSTLLNVTNNPNSSWKYFCLSARTHVLDRNTGTLQRLRRIDFDLHTVLCDLVVDIFYL